MKAREELVDPFRASEPLHFAVPVGRPSSSALASLLAPPSLLVRVGRPFRRTPAECEKDREVNRVGKGRRSRLRSALLVGDTGLGSTARG